MDQHPQDQKRLTVPTGHSRADAVVKDLEGIFSVPVQEHAALYQSAHEKLTVVLEAQIQSSPASHG